LPAKQPSLAAFHLAGSQSSACQTPARKLYTTIKSHLRQIFISYHCPFINVCQPPAASQQSLPTNSHAASQPASQATQSCHLPPYS
jgi:hypothetical protein